MTCLQALNCEAVNVDESRIVVNREEDTPRDFLTGFDLFCHGASRDPLRGQHRNIGFP